MRDSRIGTFGVMALIFSIGLRAVAIADIATHWHVFVALIAAHALSRGVLPAQCTGSIRHATTGSAPAPVDPSRIRC